MFRMIFSGSMEFLSLTSFWMGHLPSFQDCHVVVFLANWDQWVAMALLDKIPYGFCRPRRDATNGGLFNLKKPNRTQQPRSPDESKTNLVIVILSISLCGRGAPVLWSHQTSHQNSTSIEQENHEDKGRMHLAPGPYHCNGWQLVGCPCSGSNHCSGAS